MGSEKSVTEYSNRIQDLMNKLQAAGHIAAELETKRALLRRLRAELTTRAEVIHSSGLDYTATVSNLVVRETTMSEYGPNKNRALFTMVKPRKKLNKHKHKECYYCGGKRHISQNCLFNSETKNYKGRKESKKATSAGDVAMVIETCGSISSKEEQCSAKRMLDSACTSIFCSQREYFERMEARGSEILVGNNETVIAEGVRSNKLQSDVNGV